MNRLLKKIYTRSKKLVKKLNKTLTHNELQKCNKFCKSYTVELDRREKKGSIKYNVLYRPPTKEENEFAFNTCKKTFCNSECEGFDKQFKNKIRDSFQVGYSKKKIAALKHKGAISGCVEVE